MPNWEFSCEEYPLNCTFFLQDDCISGEYAAQIETTGRTAAPAVGSAVLTFVKEQMNQVKVVTWLRQFRGHSRCVNYIGHTSYGDISLDYKNPVGEWGEWWIAIAMFYYDPAYDLRLGFLGWQDPATGIVTKIKDVTFGSGAPDIGNLYFKARGVSEYKEGLWYSWYARLRIDNTDIMVPPE